MPSPSRTSSVDVIATLGPSSWERATALAAAGATGFRLNGSHLSSAALGESVAELRSRLPRVPIVVDLQGAKMRLGRFPERRLRRGDGIDFVLAPTAEPDGAVPVPHPELFAAAQAGDQLHCDDDRLRFEVVAVGGHSLRARCTTAGTLIPRKAINRRDHPVELDRLSTADRQQIERVANDELVRFAFSFMKDGREAAWVRQLAPGRAVIGKIERRQAVERLPAIAAEVDELWICRGDLGAQLGLVELARVVAKLRPDRFDVPMLMAGQVLEHLTAHPAPTRAEICHLYDLLVRGFAGIVLSDETAIGADPVGAVAVARRLVDAWTGKPG